MKTKDNLPSTPPELIGQFRNRIKEFKYVPAAKLQGHPKNWRSHPPEQISLLNRLMGEIGYAGVNLAIESDGGNYTLIDGHARTGLVGDEADVPVLVLDLSEREAEKLLASYDPIALMAEADLEKIEELLRGGLFEDDSILSDITALLNSAESQIGSVYPETMVQGQARRPITPMELGPERQVICPECGHKFVNA